MVTATAGGLKFLRCAGWRGVRSEVSAGAAWHWRVASSFGTRRARLVDFEIRCVGIKFPPGKQFGNLRNKPETRGVFSRLAISEKRN
jgi:hypothetical protein